MPERTDRELIELAAKAAGYEVDCGFSDCPLIFGEDAGPDGPREWNPLDFKGDALQLAVRLNMSLTVMKAFCGAKPNYGGNGIDLPTLGEDKGAVLCRAIVMVAAEIGANMQS